MTSERRMIYVCGGRSFHATSSGRKIESVVECWRRLGWDVNHVCGGDVAGRDAAAREYGAPDVYTRWYRKAPGVRELAATWSEVLDVLHDRKMREAIRSIAADERPHLIWERSSRLHEAGAAVAREFGVPYVHEWKDTIPAGFSFLRGYAARREVKKSREADYVVVESQVIRDDLVRDGVDADRIIVAWNAVEPEMFRHDPVARVESRRALAAADDEILIGYLGSYAFYHDVSRLVRASEILRRDAGIRFKTVLVGTGKEYPEVLSLSRELGLLGTVVLMEPPVPAAEVPAILSALDIAVLPGSTDFICPIKIQEYMAAGLPTVAPDYECNREVIRNRENGIVFEPGNAEALARTIADLARDPALRRRLGDRAREDVLARFTWEKTWGAALEDVFARTGGSAT